MKRALVISALLLLLPLRAGAAAPKSIPSTGEPHILTLLVEFRNVRFSVEDPRAQFDAMLNGRVRDYFMENSQGTFRPRFDVYGPILLDAPMADFGRNITSEGERIGDVAPELAMYEACRTLQGVLDYKRYDADGDGTLDLVIFFYAGYDEAAAGPPDAIWSHHAVTNILLPIGWRLGYYFCSSELRGNAGTELCGIGATVHEMGHALGLPDFYDTNGGADGVAGGPYQFSVMGTGLYNDGGDTPPYLGAMERILLGWMPWNSLASLRDGWMQLAPVWKNAGAMSPAGKEGEFFLYEFRGGLGWDAPLPRGLVVYHVDRSDREVDGTPAIRLWNRWREDNRINASGKHPCYYLVPPLDPGNLNYPSASNAGTLVFPGVGNVHGFDPVDWDGIHTPYQISCIDIDGAQLRMRVWEREGRQISGLVVDSNGAPVAGASVALLQGGTELSSDVTGMDGAYLLPLGGEGSDALLSLVARKIGYRTVSARVSASESSYVNCIYLRLFDSEAPATGSLYKYDPSSTSGYFPVNEPVIGAVRFTPEDLAPYAGQRISRVRFFPYATQETSPLYITVDYGDERRLSHKVMAPHTGEYLTVTEDFSEEDLLVPEGLDVYVGYGFMNGGAYLGTVYPGTAGNSYYSPFSLHRSDWMPLVVQEASLPMDLMLRLGVEELPSDNLPQLGYPVIEFAPDGTPSLKMADESLLFRVEWKREGTAAQAHLFYKDGREEIIFAEP